MNTILRRSLAATAAGALVAAGSLALTAPTATAAAEDHRALARTGFGYAAYSFGSQLVVDGVEPLSARRGYSEIKCTAFSGRASNASILPAEVEEMLPQNVRDILDLGVLKTANETFTANGGKVHGTKGVASLASLSVGGQVVEDLTLPKLTIKGLTSTAVAQHTAGKGYRSIRDFDLGRLEIDIAEDSVVAGTPLADLLEVIEQATGEVTQNVDPIIDELLALTTEFGVIDIPGLGAIALRGQGGRATATGATAEAYTLDLKIDPDGAKGAEWAPTRLKLGRAFTRIGGPVYGGVFRSHSVPFKLSLLTSDLLTLQTAGTQAMPCEGTGGKTRTHRFPRHQVLSALGAISVDGATATFSGKHFRSGRIVDGRTTSRPYSVSAMQTRIGEFAIPLAGVSIKDLVTKVVVNTQEPVVRNGQRTMVRSITRSASEVLLGGQAHKLPAAGQLINFRFDGGSGVLEGLPIGKGFYGKSVKPLRLTLFSSDTEDIVRIVIGEANANLMPNA